MMMERLGLNTGDDRPGKQGNHSIHTNAAADADISSQMDGKIGPRTKEALHRLQTALGLPQSDSLTPQVSAALNDPTKFAALKQQLASAVVSPATQVPNAVPPALSSSPITLNATGQQIGNFMATIVQQTPFGEVAPTVSPDRIVSMSAPQRADVIEAAFGNVNGVTKDHRLTVGEAAVIEARLNTPQAGDDVTKVHNTKVAFEGLLHAAGIKPSDLPQLAAQNANREIQLQSTPAGAVQQQQVQGGGR